jgi:hypothetical protein
MVPEKIANACRDLNRAILPTIQGQERFGEIYRIPRKGLFVYLGEDRFAAVHNNYEFACCWDVIVPIGESSLNFMIIVETWNRISFDVKEAECIGSVNDILRKAIGERWISWYTPNEADASAYERWIGPYANKVSEPLIAEFHKSELNRVHK